MVESFTSSRADGARLPRVVERCTAIVALFGATLCACSNASPQATPPFPSHAAQVAPAPAFSEGDRSYDCGPGPLPPNVLFDPGQQNVALLHRQADRVLSKGDGRWILWDATSRRQIAQGTFTPPRSSRQNQTPTFSDLAGSTILVPVTGEVLELRSARDGSLRARVTMSGTLRQTGLSVDGSYAYSADRTGLRVWSSDGALVLQRPGDYYESTIFADKDALYLAHGPTNTQTVETIALDGESSFSRRYLGSFGDWFTDGTHFVTTTRTDVYVYDRDARLVQTVRVADPESDPRGWHQAGGHGKYFWIDDEEVSVYELGLDAPILTIPAGDTLQPSRGGTVGFLTEDRSELVQLDFRGLSPQVTTTPLPSNVDLSIYAAGADGTWAIGGAGTIYLPAAADATAPLAALGCGALRHIAGAPTGAVAIATSDSRVIIHDRAAKERSFVTAIPVSAETVALSADGSSLLALGPQGLGSLDRGLRVVSLPDGTIDHTFTVTPEETQRFAMSADGQRIARLVCQAPNDGSACVLHLEDPSGDPLADVATVDPPLSERSPNLRMTPDGKHVAVFRAVAPASTAIYDEAGKLVKSLAGRFVGFLDDTRMLVHRGQRYDSRPEGEALLYRYDVVDVTDRPLATFEQTVWYEHIQPYGRDHFHNPATHSLYRIADGVLAWSPTSPSTSVEAGILGTLAGSTLVFSSHGLVYDAPIPPSIQ